MAPLEDKFERLQQLSDEQLIIGTTNGLSSSTNWLNDGFGKKSSQVFGAEQQRASLKRSLDQKLELQQQLDQLARQVRERARRASVAGEIQQLNRIAEFKRNYGTCQQLADQSNQQTKLADREQKRTAESGDSPCKSCRLEREFEPTTEVVGRLGKSFEGHLTIGQEAVKTTSASLESNLNGDGSTGGPEEEPSGGKATLLERAAKVIPGLGIILALCASLSLGTAGMLVKLTHSVNGIQVAILRSLIQFVIYAFIISFRKISLLPEKGEWIPVFSRACLGASSMCFTYYALNLIPLGDATAIRFSLPIWTLIVSYFFLNESCQFTKVFAVLVAVFGVVLIAKPDDCLYLGHILLRSLGMESGKEFELHQHEHEEAREHELESVVKLDEHHLSANINQTLNTNGSVAPDFVVLNRDKLAALAASEGERMAARQFGGCMLALASSILLSLSLIALRLAKKTPAEITIFWLSVLSILIGNSILFALNEWSLPDNLLDLFYILLNGLCGSAGQWFITSALKIEQSGIIALARTFDIEVAFLYSALLLHEDIRTTR